jgi:Zn-dependent M28 family amino/carboxypeptidase
MQRKHFSQVAVLSLVTLLSAIYLNAVASVPPAPQAAQGAAAEFSADRYLQQVVYLSRDEMKGRGNGSPELEKAADYLAEQFKAFGLSPAGEGNTYFQTFQVTTGAALGPKSELQLNGVSLKVNQDYVPIAFSNTAEVAGALAFVGYGITAPEFNYDDYAGINVSGKIVLALRHEPQELDPKSVFNGTNFTSHATFINKAVNAKAHGAKGVIFITDPNNHSAEEQGVGNATRSVETDNVGIPAVHAKREAFIQVFKDAGKDLATIQTSIDSQLKPQSFDLPSVQARVATDVIRTRKPERNVIGAITGSDPVLKNEWVVVGAHYDHLGLGDSNSLAPSQIGQIHHGADDNASGTAGVLELAREAAKNRSSLKRSILFMTFAGEELGLLGSSNFVNHPTIPLANVMGMINLDMIGRVSNDRIYIEGVGTSPNFRPWLDKLNESVGLMIEYSSSASGGSDHMSFNSKKIPVVFFFSGLHADYHKPSDTYDKINAAGGVKVLSLAYLMLQKMATEHDRLQYTAVRPPQQPAGGGGGGSGYGPYFGSIPDFREDMKGVLFADVQADSPAAKAGLKPGDLLVRFDDAPIENLYDFTYALRTKKPGDMVRVVVKRGSQQVQATVTLEARK